MRVETIVPLNDWRAVPDVAKAAESAGYDGIGTAEIANDPFTPLALAALATERIRLSTGIVVAFPRSPMVMAQIAWDLQQHSGGRFALGLGSQVKGHIVRRFGVPWASPVPRMREYVEALRAIWRTWEKREPLRYEGEHYRLTLMTPEFSPRPSGLPPVPVMVAAVGPDMIRMSGRVCRESRRAFGTPPASVRSSRSGEEVSSRPVRMKMRSRSRSTRCELASHSTARLEPTRGSSRSTVSRTWVRSSTACRSRESGRRCRSRSRMTFSDSLLRVAPTTRSRNV